MTQRQSRMASRLLALQMVLWVAAHNSASAQTMSEQFAGVPSSSLGLAYLFGFFGGLIIFVALLVLKLREKPQGAAK